MDYSEIAPPLLVRDEIMFGTAQLPKFAEDQFAAQSIKKIDLQNYFEQGPEVAAAVIHLIALYFKGDDPAVRAALMALPSSIQGRDELVRLFTERNFWLIPTAEVPLTNLVRESVRSYLD